MEEFQEIVFLSRRLDEEDTNSTSSYNDAEVLRNTFTVYGSVLAVVFLLFCCVRLKFPRAYTIRNWVEDLQTPLASDQYKFFSWMWKLFIITDDEFLQECGMDALCFIRVLHMGYKLALMGVFNAIWLMPLYSTSDESNETADITDGVVKVTISNVPAGSARLIGTALASYFVFGYVMYLILDEFEWFIEMRHKFLMKPMARNYAVYVRHIPLEYRSNQGLRDFFRQCFAHETVLQAHIRMKTPHLASKVSQREAVISKLEHAIAQENFTGVTPTHSTNLAASLVPGVDHTVNSIEAYTDELVELNKDISERIDALRAKMMTKSIMYDVEKQSVANYNRSVMSHVDALHGVPDGASTTDDPLRPQNDTDVNDSSHSASIKDVSGKVFAGGIKGVKKITTSATGAVGNVAASAVSILKTEEDGEFYESGFVVFSKLGTQTAALQLLHHSTPFAVEAMEAPEPDDIFWLNVGRTHKDLQLGKLFSLAATAGLCLLWTIPMSFFASLSSVDALREELKFMNKLFDKAPWLVPIFEQLAPLLVVLFNALLPIILEIFSMLEGPVSGSVVGASLFTKLAAFMIIQTFFVSAISGGVLQAISKIIEDPTSVIDLLATSLPTQSTYFIQIVFVSTVVGTGLEMLRLIPFAKALLRKCIGPRLTKKERQKTFLCLRPLADPQEFEHADYLSNLVLYFMVILVYAVIAPLVSFIVAFCMLFMGAVMRHQFVYIYPTTPDSGGQMWMNFVHILCSCMLIAEITIAGLLGLKKATIATPLMIPLIIISFLFTAYIRQKHFRTAENLPSRDALKQDLKNGDDFDLSFVHDAYLQPELHDKELFPDVSDERAQQLGLYDTESPQSYGCDDEKDREESEHAEQLETEVTGTSEESDLHTASGTLSPSETASFLNEASFGGRFR